MVFLNSFCVYVGVPIRRGLVPYEALIFMNIRGTDFYEQMCFVLSALTADFTVSLGVPCHTD